MFSDHTTFDGKMIIITAPSGAGKTTIVRHLLKVFDFLEFSISATTRPKRDHEREGIDYFFKSVEDFQKLIANRELVEWEEVYTGTFYGTLRSEVHRIWNSGRHIVFDIDVQGAMELQRQFPDVSLSIFVKPPGRDVLIERLTSRKTESESSLKRRIDKAQSELECESKFDLTLLNDDLETALNDAEKMILNYIFGEEE